MTTETELMNQALERDLGRYLEANDHERERIFNRMIDTVIESTRCFQSQAAIMVREMIKEARG